VVLGGHGRNLALCGAEGLHVQARQPGIDIHEHTVRAFRPRARWLRHAVSHRHQGIAVGLRGMHIPGTVKGAEHARLVGGEHFLGPDGEHDVGGAGAHIVHGEMEGRGGRGASVFHIHHRDPRQPAGTQRNLAAHHVLTFHVPLHAVAKEGRLNVRSACSGILQHTLEGLGGERFEGSFQMLAERRHADTGHKYIAHGERPPRAG